jgi:hypothetical protein
VWTDLGFVLENVLISENVEWRFKFLFLWVQSWWHTPHHTHTGPARTLHTNTESRPHTAVAQHTHIRDRTNTQTVATAHNTTHSGGRATLSASGALLTHEHSKHSPCITNALQTVQNAVSMMARVLESPPIYDDRNQSRCQGLSFIHQVCLAKANTNSAWRMQVPHNLQLLSQSHTDALFGLSLSVPLSLCVPFFSLCRVVLSFYFLLFFSPSLWHTNAQRHTCSTRTRTTAHSYKHTQTHKHTHEHAHNTHSRLLCSSHAAYLTSCLTASMFVPKAHTKEEKSVCVRERDQSLLSWAHHF